VPRAGFDIIFGWIRILRAEDMDFLLVLEAEVDKLHCHGFDEIMGSMPARASNFSVAFTHPGEKSLVCVYPCKINFSETLTQLSGVDA
jgi:hypothetical protein